MRCGMQHGQRTSECRTSRLQTILGSIDYSTNQSVIRRNRPPPIYIKIRAVPGTFPNLPPVSCQLLCGGAYSEKTNVQKCSFWLHSSRWSLEFDVELHSTVKSAVRIEDALRYPT